MLFAAAAALLLLLVLLGFARTLYLRGLFEAAVAPPHEILRPLVTARL